MASIVFFDKGTSFTLAKLSPSVGRVPGIAEFGGCQVSWQAKRNKNGMILRMETP